MLEEEALAISERRGSILPRATLVTFAFFIYVWLWWKAIIYHRRCSKDLSYHTCFLCPILSLNCAEKPHCDVITGKGRYFRAPLSFIWMLSSSLVLQKRWQHKNLMPTFEIEPCHCRRPTKEWWILNRFIRISFLRQQIVTLHWQMASWERQHQTFALPRDSLFKIYMRSFAVVHYQVHRSLNYSACYDLRTQRTAAAQL